MKNERASSSQNFNFKNQFPGQVNSLDQAEKNSEIEEDYKNPKNDEGIEEEDEIEPNTRKISEFISGAVQEVKKQAQEYSEDFVEYIKESPLKSALIVSLIGLLIGKLVL